MTKLVIRATKSILMLDFDGVCHSYTSGWKGADNIPDPPVEGLFEFLASAKEKFQVAIFSSRSLQEGGIEAMQDWFREHGGDEAVDGLLFPQEKPPAHVGLDDRVLTFTGEWPDVGELEQFTSWVEE